MSSQAALPTDLIQGEGKLDLSTVQSVEKALLIVELLMRRGEALSARDIALQTGINRTTSHRLLNALMHRGWIEKEPGSAAYRSSLRYLVLSHIAYLQRDVLAVIRPTIQRLSDLSRETVHVGVLDGFEVIHVDKIESPERVGISSRIGSRAHPHAAALGKAILAASAGNIVEAYIKHACKLPKPDTLTDSAWLRADLLATRQRGFSIDDEEDSIGVRCIGAAIMAGNGDPILAVSITGPAGRFSMERARQFAPYLRNATSELSRSFGWEPGQEERGPALATAR